MVLPFIVWQDSYDSFARQLLSGEYAYEVFLACIALLVADVFIPIPSSAVSVTAGLFLGAPAAFFACLIGLTIGCFLGYGFGYYFRKMHFERWHADVEFRGLSEQFSRYDYLILLAFRGVPLLAEMSVMVAGFHRYSLWKFSLVTLVGNSVLAGLYSHLGDSATNLTSIYLGAILFVLIPILTFSLRAWWVNRLD